jgi:hypothetical protein
MTMQPDPNRGRITERDVDNIIRDYGRSPEPERLNEIEKMLESERGNFEKDQTADRDDTSRSTGLDR